MMRPLWRACCVVRKVRAQRPGASGCVRGMHGLFIALEGTDGSGLSTQAEGLGAWFRVERMRARGVVERCAQRARRARVRANCQRLVPVPRPAGPRIAVVDGTASIAAVHAAIVAQVMDLTPLR